MSYKHYLKTDHWKEFRQKLIEERGCCERCGSTEGLEVHHNSYCRIGNEAPEDVEVLCHVCHLEESGIPDEELKEIMEDMPDEL